MVNLLDQVDEYLAGRLQGDALDEFETELLSNQALQEAVMRQSQLKAGLTEASSSLTGADAGTDAPNIWENLVAFFWRPQLAYGLSLVIVSGTLLNLPDQQPDHLFVEDIVYIDQTRSAKPTVINLTSNRQFLLALDLNTTPEVNVSLKHGDEVVFSSISQPNEAGSINVVLPLLAAGEYQLEVTNSEIKSNYLLAVRNQSH